MFDPQRISYEPLLTLFWEAHDPTQGMRQGNDVGSQYRSVIFTHTDAQARGPRTPHARCTRRELMKAGYGGDPDRDPARR